jgi:hypothetical protein
MKYSVIRKEYYDYVGQSYATLYPNLHCYPTNEAGKTVNTMLFENIVVCEKEK